MIYIHLPKPTENDRIELFLSNLGKELEAQGRLTSTQVQFFHTKNSSIPDFNDAGQMERMPLGYENFLGIVYDVSAIERITAALRNALTTTWPTRDDLQPYEIEAGKKRSLWVVRGDKQ